MRYISSVISFAVIFFISSCSSLNDNQINSKVNGVYYEDGLVSYIGPIEDKKNIIAFGLFESKDIVGFKISSPGGGVNSGIALANKLRALGIDVYIGKLCASSCANYIIPAARNVIVDYDSTIIWHGSSFQEDASIHFLNGEEEYIAWRNLEIDFFNRVGVSPLLTVCGIDQVSFFDNLLHNLNFRKIAGFTYDIEELKKFGLNNISLKDGNWKKASVYNGMRVKNSKFCSELSWRY